MTEEVNIQQETETNINAEAIPSKGEFNDGTHIEGEVKPVSKWETQARASGWVPLEDWEGDPEDHVDAREYVKRGELFHRISNQSSEIKDLKRAISGLMDHHKKVKENEFTRALEYLKQQKKTALEEGDADRLLAVDEAIDTLKQEKQQETKDNVSSASKQPTPFFVGWVKQNQWYISDPELRAFADDVGIGAFQRVQGQIDEQELYQLVKTRVMKAYPEKFKTKPNTSPVDGGTGTLRKPRTDNYQLSAEEEKVMKTFVRQGVMTKEEYINELKQINGVK